MYPCRSKHLPFHDHDLLNMSYIQKAYKLHTFVILWLMEMYKDMDLLLLEEIFTSVVAGRQCCMICMICKKIQPDMLPQYESS